MKIKIERWLRLIFLVLVLSSVTVVGCSTQQVTSSTSENVSANVSTEKQTSTIAKKTNCPAMYNNLPCLQGKATVELTINGSPVTIEVDGNNAPITAGNFVDLVSRGVYNGLVFHRVVKDPQPFVAQGGDPLGNGTGGFIDPDTKERRFIPLEIKLEGEAEPIYSQNVGRQAGYGAAPVALKHTRGAVAMARSQAPDSASSQFYVALADLDFLDGDYAVFGRVTKGMEVVDGIKQGDRIESAKIIQGKENLKN